MSKRKMLAAEEELANRVAKLAEKRGLTVYQTVNDILEQALRAEEHGLNLKEAVDRRGDMNRAHLMGLTFTVENLYYQVVEAAYGNDKDKIKDLWRDMGFWYGKYFMSKSNDPVKDLLEALSFMTHGGQFATEKGKDSELTISCINERFTRGYTEVFSIFIEAAFNILGYKPLKNEASRGIIRITFSRR